MSGANDEGQSSVKEIVDYAVEIGKSLAERIKIEDLVKILKKVGWAQDAIDAYEALFKENAAVAIIGLIAAISVVTVFGPEIAAAGTISAALAGLEGGIWASAFGAVVEATIVTNLKTGIQSGISLLTQLLAPLNQSQQEITFSGSNFDFSANDPHFASGGYNIISIKTNSGIISTTVGRYPQLGTGLLPGQVDVSLIQNQFLSFLKGSFQRLTNTAGSNFTAVLADASNRATGSLKVTLRTNAVQFVGVDQTTVNFGVMPLVNGETQLSVSLAKSGGTLIDVLDAANGNDKGQLVVDADVNGNETIDSDLANLPIVLGTGADTLLNLGAGSTIDVGGNFNAAAGHATAQYQLDVTNNTLVIGASGAELFH